MKLDNLERERASRDRCLYFRYSPDADGTLYERANAKTLFRRESLDRAKEDSVTHVVLADIADFYPGVYFHRVEETLGEVGPKWASQLLLRLLRQVNDNVSSSLPVGPPCIHLVADATLTPLDEYLIADGRSYVRLGDDFRFFCRSYREAWKALARMAEFLYTQYRLFLQPGKTRIVTATEFEEELTADPGQQAVDRLERLVEERAPDLGLSDYYTGAAPEVAELDEETLGYLRGLEWEQFLQDEIGGGYFDLQRVRYGLS